MKNWNKKDYSPSLFAGILALFVLVFTSCPTPDGDNNNQTTGGVINGGGQPTNGEEPNEDELPHGGDNNQTPTATDFYISGTGTFTYDGNSKTVIVTPKEGKTSGAITVKYNGTTAAPSTIDTYTVTFDVAEADGWNAVSGLSAGTLTINEGIPGNQTPIPYIITGSGTSFTATNSGVTIGTANQPIQTVIDAIRTHAAGKNSTIQFGNGTDVLDIGTASASFNNSGGTWGVVALTGKITSNNSNSSSGTIAISNAVSITSTADIANNGNSTNSRAVYISSGGVTISGGTVSATTGRAVFNVSTGAINISGGTVSATDGTAVYNASTGTINISGGTVSAKSEAVYNYSTGAIIISGGTVSATDGTAVYNRSYSTGTISGGTISATTYAVQSLSRLILDGSPSITGRIRFTMGGGQLTTVSGFTPGTKTYTLEYASYAVGNIAVVGGSNFLSNFTLYNKSTWYLSASDNNLIMNNTVILTIDSIPAQPYTGNAITPPVTVKDGSTTLTLNTDYTVSYSNNTNAGTATVTITGAGNYAGITGSATFTINPIVINFTIYAIPAQIYTGNAITPPVTVKDGSTTLTLNTHYTVSYSNNINVGTATVLVRGMGNYGGFTKSTTFTINPKAITFTVDAIPAQTYTGNAISPAITVKEGSTTLTQNTHYTVSYSNNTNAGIATVTVTGTGNYAGSTGSATFTINPKTTTFTVDAIPAQPYTGNAITPTITAKDGSTTLTLNTDYTVSYSNNINVGTLTATATVTGTGNYAGSKGSRTFSITKVITFTIDSIPAQIYTGNAITPPVTVKDDSTILTLNTHYTVSYSNNTNAGTATVTVTGTGNYAGSTGSATFSIDDSTTFYIITGSGTSFTATKSGVTIGTANQAIQTVINAVRTHAAGKNSTIQFGNGTDVLDIGTASASFNNSGGTWGAITLTGKITSNGNRTISIDDVISIYSTADIANTGTVSPTTTAVAIYNASTGTVNISGGIVSSTTDSAVSNHSGIINVSGTANVTSQASSASSELSTIFNYIGTVTISGGTVESTRHGLAAVLVWGDGTVIISGGKVLATVTDDTGTGKDFYNCAVRTFETGTVMISGGQVSTTGDNCYTLRNDGGVVNISGGTVQATGKDSIAVLNYGNVTISGGQVLSTGNGGYAVYSHWGTVTIKSPPAYILGQTKL